MPSKTAGKGETFSVSCLCFIDGAGRDPLPNPHRWNRPTPGIRGMGLQPASGSNNLRQSAQTPASAQQQ
jgi:hypothetical protein